MDTTTLQILKNAGASLVRAGLYALGTWLVSKGVVSENVNGTLQAHAGEIAGGAVSFAAALAWSLYQKWHVNHKIDTALALPQDTPRATLEKQT